MSEYFKNIIKQHKQQLKKCNYSILYILKTEHDYNIKYSGSRIWEVFLLFDIRDSKKFLNIRYSGFGIRKFFWIFDIRDLGFEKTFQYLIFGIRDSKKFFNIRDSGFGIRKSFSIFDIRDSGFEEHFQYSIFGIRKVSCISINPYSTVEIIFPDITV